MPTISHIRVFLASPGDVADERALVRQLLRDELPYDPLLQGRVTFELVSWDEIAAKTPMLARLTPQEAVIRFKARPADCDIVIVVLWSRLGTHLDTRKFRKSSGEPYLSGTEWEYEDACQGRPEIFIYRRTEVPKVDLNDPTLPKKLRQYQLVEQFCERVSKNLDGSFRGGVTTYDTTTDFEKRLANDLKYLLSERLDRTRPAPAVQAVPRWHGSPYPGLRPFQTAEAAIFYGRGREVDSLVARLRDPDRHFVAVVGASGTGKSSLLRAGLIPRLQDGAVEGSENWRVLTFTPSAAREDPFLALAFELVRILPAQAQKPPAEIATALAQAPRRIAEYAAIVLADRPAGEVLTLFIDQLEELFTLVAEQYRPLFIELLAHAAGQPCLNILTTLRADFLSQCMSVPALAPLLQAPAAVFPLAVPGLAAFVDIIRKPAERAGLILEEGLIDEMIKEAGSELPLSLVAFCLEELYRQTGPEHRLSLAAYDKLGRLQGAICRHVATLLEELRVTEGDALDAALSQVFQILVHVDATGMATRRRAFRNDFGEAEPVLRLVETLVRGRLLLSDETSGRATIILAHEILLQEWPELREWVDCHRAMLQRIQTLIIALHDADKQVCRSAAGALAQIGPMAAEVVPALVTALNDAKDWVRASAAGALGQIGPAAAEVVPALIITLSDADEWVRASAAGALGQIGPAADEAIPALITTLSDADEWVRASAAGALGQIGPAADETVPALITALGDGNEDVRMSAAQALGRIGPAAVPLLIATLRESEASVRRGATKALEQIGPTEAVPALITTLDDADKWVRASAAGVLGQVGPAAAEAVPALIGALGDADEWVRTSAAGALGKIGPGADEAVPVLIATLNDADEWVRASAAQALGRIGPAAVPVLIAALDDSSADVRAGAAKALGQIGSAAAEAVPALRA